MMTKIYQAFKGQSSSAPSRSVTLTLALTNIPANVEGENATNTAIKKPPSHTEGETEHLKMAIPISSIQPTKFLPTQAQPITTITTHPESFQAAPRIDKGKGIATKSDEDPSKKLVPATTIVRPDPDEEVKKAVEKARLLAISKPKLIKVVQEEAENIGLDLNKIASAKAGTMIRETLMSTNLSSSQTLGSLNWINWKSPFQRWSDINKVGMKALVSYLVAASMVKSPENARFSMKLRKLIAEHPDQEKLK
ncbi:hypothetical protein Tco_0769878 [Tanacetum coccineum]|uniref:Uncharacterized protein n=1 Tax=Tanacetum coccineum TaxID=301880 RepID=A0ABQ4ZBL4_9ASTR